MGFLSLEPSLHRVLRKEPPAANTDTPGQILSAGQLVAHRPRLQAQCLGELLDRV
jgi:hypothetical protein